MFAAASIRCLQNKATNNALVCVCVCRRVWGGCSGITSRRGREARGAPVGLMTNEAAHLSPLLLLYPESCYGCYTHTHMHNGSGAVCDVIDYHIIAGKNIEDSMLCRLYDIASDQLGNAVGCPCRKCIHTSHSPLLRAMDAVLADSRRSGVLLLSQAAPRAAENARRMCHRRQLHISEPPTIYRLSRAELHTRHPRSALRTLDAG